MKRSTAISLIILTVIGAVLRLYNIGFQPLQCDEAYTLMLAKKPFIDLIIFTLTNDFTPPTFYILAHISYIATGFADFAIRIPSAIFGILTIPAMYCLGRVYRYETGKEDGEIVGLFAAAITTLLFPLIYYSQFARAYEMVFFAGVVFFTSFIYIRRSLIAAEFLSADLQIPLDDYKLLGFLGGICVWIHLFAIIPVALTILTLFFTTDRRNAMAASTIAIIAALPLSILFWGAYSYRSQLALMFGMGIHDMLVYIPVEFFNWGFFVIIPLIVLELWLGRSDRLVPEIFVIVIATFIVGIFASLFTPAFPRYFFPVLPLLIVMAASAMGGIISMVKKPRMKPVVAFGFLFLLLLTQAVSIMEQYWSLRFSC